MYYQHHLLLVESVFLLQQNCVDKRDVKHSSKLLQQYVFMFASLYGMLLGLLLVGFFNGIVECYEKGAQTITETSTGG